MPDGQTTRAIVKTLEQAIHSAEGIKAAVRAANDGLPALAGVDALLRRELGSEYARADSATWWAGSIVDRIMREMGFIAAGKAKCPSDCVAVLGTVWRPAGAPMSTLGIVRNPLPDWR